MLFALFSLLERTWTFGRSVYFVPLRISLALLCGIQLAAMLSSVVSQLYPIYSPYWRSPWRTVHIAGGRRDRAMHVELKNSRFQHKNIVLRALECDHICSTCLAARGVTLHLPRVVYSARYLCPWFSFRSASFSQTKSGAVPRHMKYYQEEAAAGASNDENLLWYTRR